MRIVFAGTPHFAAASLRALVDAGHEVPLVLTQPDRPAGRGMKLAESDVKQLSQRRNLPVFQPQSLRDDAVTQRIAETRSEAMVVAAYGLILPRPVLDAFPLGCINVHASLLPRWRGAAPIQRAILAGDRETGISIMRMEQGLDTGPVYLMQRIPIAADDTAGSLHDKLAALGARCIVESLPGIARGSLSSQAQLQNGVTYAAKISKADAVLDWSADAADLERRVRAFNPFPGASTTWRGEAVKVWSAAPAAGHGEPGTVLRASEEGIVVACGNAALRLDQLQRAGGRRLGATEFLRGAALVAGERLGA